MRTKLKQIDRVRTTFTAMVERYGTKNGYKGPVQTILLTNVARADTKEVLTDHVWFTAGKQLQNLPVKTSIQFDACVCRYIKGYQGNRADIYDHISVDYRLERPTKVQIIATNQDELRDENKI